MLYQGNNNLYVDPKQVGLAYEEVIFESQGLKLHGWYFTQTTLKPSKGVILFFHGNAQNRSSHFLALRYLLEKGYDYFIFDYRGYADSEGKASPENTVKDGLAALDVVTKRNPTLPVSFFGQSLGGAVAMRTLVEYKRVHGMFPDSVKLLVLDSTFLSYQKAAASILSKHAITFLFQPLSFLISDTWAPVKVCDEFPRIPVLIFHGDQDQLFKETLGEEVYEAFRGPKRFVHVIGGHHTSALYEQTDDYRNTMYLELERYLRSPDYL